MNHKQIIDLCHNNLDYFESILPSYEVRGIFNSEMLLVCSFISALKEKYPSINIIESGRARGYSTFILANFFKDNKIFSIDLADDGDIKYSYERLKDYKNVDLIDGDSREVIYSYLNSPCVVIIDGPKGKQSIELAQSVLEKETVLAVFIHDLYKPRNIRTMAEDLFDDPYFSDDKDFIENFAHLDKDCWGTLKALRGLSSRPYYRNNYLIGSYAMTIGCILNKGVIL